jgi:hypothetical protein
MTHKKTVLKIVVSAAATIALGIVFLSSAVRHSAPIEEAHANRTIGADPKIAELPNPGLSRVRLLVSNLN